MFPVFGALGPWDTHESAAGTADSEGITRVNGVSPARESREMQIGGDFAGKNVQYHGLIPSKHVLERS